MDNTQKQYGKLAVTPEEMASNRASLQNSLSNMGTRSIIENGSVKPITPIDTNIRADNINNYPDVSISNAKTPSLSVGLSSEISSKVKAENAYAQDDLTTQLNQNLEKARPSFEKSISKLDTFLGNRKSQSEIENEALKSSRETGISVDEAAKTLRKLDTQINAIDIRANEQIKKIQENEQGLYGGASQQEINRVQRQAATDKADLYIQKLVAQGDYDSARSIADRKIQIALEQDKLDFEKYTFDYENNKEVFDKAEQRVIESMIRKQERDFNKEESERKNFETTKIDLLRSMNEQGAPQEIKERVASMTFDNSDIGTIVNTAGIYGGDVLDRQIKQAQLQNLYSQIAERDANGQVAIDSNGKVLVKQQDAQKINKELVSNDAYKAIRKGQDSLQFLTDFEQSLQEFGSTSGVFDPIKNAKLAAKYNATILNLKEFFNLGVLNGPDEAILKSIIPDPTNVSNFKKAISLGIYQPGTKAQAGISNMKEQIESTIDDRYKSLSAQYGDYSPESISSLRDLQRVYIEQKKKLNPNINTLIEENPNLTYDDIINIITQ